jgi:hypothetical protein
MADHGPTARSSVTPKCYGKGQGRLGNPSLYGIPCGFESHRSILLIGIFTSSNPD